MKTSRKLLTLAASMFAFAAIMTPQAAMAAQTPPCTEISNRATINFEVGLVPQTEVLSKDGTGADQATKFNVGVKVLVGVTQKDDIDKGVIPSSTGSSYLKFEITNDGNAELDHLLEWANMDGVNSPHGTNEPDSFSLREPAGDDTDSTVFLYADDLTDGAAIVGLYDATDNLIPANTITIGPGITKTIFVVYSPKDLVAPMDSISVNYLKATSKWKGGGAITLTDGNGTETVNELMSGSPACGGGILVDVVAGDDDQDGAGTLDELRNGADLDVSAFVVQNAKISVKKEMVVYSDPHNGIRNPTSLPPVIPKAIPGAIVTYIITVTNEGNVAATAVKVLDAELAAEIGANSLAFVTAFEDLDNDCTAIAGRGIVVDGTCKTNAYTANDDGASWNDALDPDGALNKLAVTGLTVPAKVGLVNGEVKVKFQMEIK